MIEWSDRLILNGILPALITPLTESGAVNEASLERLLERVYASGVDGVYLCGSTGEGMRMPAHQRKQVVDRAVRLSPRAKTVIVHVGAKQPEESVELARHAEQVGAHVLSSLPPAGEFAGIGDYYTQVAQAASLPFLLYYFPEIAPGIRTMERDSRVVRDPNVVGLKFTDFDLFRMSMLAREGLTVFNGRDEVLAAGLLMGAAGGIGSTYNLVPELFVELYKATRACDFVQARKLQDRINDLLVVLLRYPFIPAIKMLLGWSGINCGPSLGARELTREEAGDLRTAVREAGFEALA